MDMTIDKLLATLRKLDVSLSVDGDRLRCRAPKGAITSELQTELSSRKIEIIEFLRSASAFSEKASPPLRRSTRNGPPPASFGQQRLWFLQQLDLDSFAYNIPAAVQLIGPLDVDALEQSIDEMVARHETLRTTLSLVDGDLVQVIGRAGHRGIPLVDLTGVAKDEREDHVARLATQEAQRPFDLANGPLWRMTLLKLDVEEHVLVVVQHHSISDGWSITVFVSELGTLYEAHTQGQPSPLEPLSIQYGDFATWQRQWLTGEVLDRQLDYWKEKLGRSLPPLELPTDFPRPAIQTFAGTWETVELPQELGLQLKKLSQGQGVSLFMTLLAAFDVLMFRYTGQSDLVIGTSNGNRNHVETEPLIGFFLNTLTLRADMSGNPSVREVIRQVRNVSLEAYENQDLPFERLVEELQPDRNLSRSPIFDVMFILHNAPQETLELTDLRIRPVEYESGTAKYDLTLSVRDNDNFFRCELEYNTDLFTAETARRLLRHFRTICEAFTADPDRGVDDIAILPENERQQIVENWNATQADYPRDATIHRLFERQVARTPNDIAIECGQEQLTYLTLNSRADEIAAELIAHGVETGELVGICVERSLEMLVAVLGVLKAGAAFVPLEPSLPKLRLELMLKDSQTRLVLTRPEYLPLLEAANVNVVNLDRDWDVPQDDPTRQEATRPSTADDTAYVIYTSGSTGTPKGVQIGHRSLVNFIESMRDTPGLTADDVWLSVTTLSFDISLLELFLPITTGARVVIAPDEIAHDADLLAAALRDSGTTIIQATPATWHMLVQSGWRAAPELTILCGGEALSRELADELVSSGATVWNMYGPTETTIWSTVFEVTAGKGTVPIGTPIANTEIYVLDANLQPVPIGVAGELYIGGEGLALGYLRRPELTAEKFIPDPFRNTSEARLYRTGDRARFLSDGCVEYLGRFDHQVKIRGFRIELGEIQTSLVSHPAVAEAVVVAREETQGDKRLVAYLTNETPDPPTVSELRHLLSDSLPLYMIPSEFMFLDEFPRTPNGKLDRRALPAPGADRPVLETDYVSPRNEFEESIAAAWREVLNKHEVGIHDNFFDLGGHSLLLVQLHGLLRDRLATPLPMVDLFRFPTVALLAEHLSSGDDDPDFLSDVQDRATRQLASSQQQATRKADTT